MAASNFDLTGFLNDPQTQADKAAAVEFLKSKGIIDERGAPVPGMSKQVKAPTIADKVKDVGHKVIGGVVNALTSSEQAFGKNIASGVIGNTQNKNIEQQNATLSNIDLNNIKTIIGLKDKAKKNGHDTTHYDTLLKNYQMTNGSSLSEIAPSINKSNLQVLGDSAGTLLDLLSFGTYGEGAKGAESRKLLLTKPGITQNIATKIGIPTTERFTSKLLPLGAKPALSQTLKTIGVNTAKRAVVGAATGYGYDVTGNLQQGKTGASSLKPGMGTITGGTIPIIIGGVQSGVAIAKDTAPRFINSLIKPKQVDFSYGKDPGRTVSELGITGNSLSDFESNIRANRQDIGSMISATYENPQVANVKINAEPEINKIDEAISKAAKGGKENQGVVSTLQNIKDALLYEHGVDSEGNIVKVGKIPRDLSALNPQETFDLKKVVAEQTKFTGRPTDDKTINSVLKDIYGGLKEKLNTAVSPYSPEITDLNQKYADLTSAELAVKNREMIVSRSNLISAPIKFGTAAGIITAVTTGGAALPAILVGASAAALDKALESTAVKTRIAAWLGSAEPGVISKLLQQNPEIKTVLYRLMPKLSSKIGK